MSQNWNKYLYFCGLNFDWFQKFPQIDKNSDKRYAILTSVKALLARLEWG